jgi:glycolate oxidase FAD binding subunit
MPLSPISDADELADMIRAAAAVNRRLDLRGGGSKSAVGLPLEGIDTVPMGGFRGIVDYDPAELVLTARAGTPLAEVETLVASESQMLAFDPFDHGPLFGAQPGQATIGGVVAAGVAGSRRLSAGAARDHVLRIVAVSGRGESFTAGAKVVKNVTGYDLPKLMCGSWGRLAALTEVTLKTLPRPEASATLAFHGFGRDDAQRVMLAAMASTASVAAAAHVPGLRGESAITALRLEGVEPSIRARTDILARHLNNEVPFDVLDGQKANIFWAHFRDFSLFAPDLPLWRVHLPARAWTRFITAVEPLDVHWMVDWAGSLVWLATAAPATALRQAASALQGHAMLLRRGPQSGADPIFHPPTPAVAMLEERLRRAFDPKAVFETGRFGDRNAD